MLKLKALDSFYTDETKMVEDGQVFTVDSEAFAKDLVARGVAREAADDETPGKERKSQSAAPKNKDAGAAPSNKAQK